MKINPMAILLTMLAGWINIPILLNGLVSGYSHLLRVGFGDN
jgi:hypothetical protein